VNLVLANSYQTFKRIVRAFLVRDLWQQRQVKCTELRLGDDGARWCICPDGLSVSSVVYSFGVREDVSFELELIRQFGVRVNVFDPTLRSIEWLRKQALPEKIHFYAYGLAEQDRTCKFSPPRNPAHVSHSIVGRKTTRAAIEVPVRRLASIMRALGHKRIVLLKMDVEGAEYGVIADAISSGIPVGQLLVEFHHRWPEIGIEKTEAAIRALNRAGYSIFSISASGEEYSFQRTADDLVSLGANNGTHG
jgi:FkbM family methyltransferase